MLTVIGDFFHEVWRFIGWEGILVLLVAAILATKYHLGRIDRNTKIANKARQLNRKFRLKKDYQIKFFCRIFNRARIFVIKEGTVVLRFGRYCLVRLCTAQEMIPDKIVVNHGTNDFGYYVFKISKKRLKETLEEFKPRGFILKDRFS